MSSTEMQLPRPLQQAIETYAAWGKEQLHSEQNNNIIDNTLYHYTDFGGLAGIIKNSEIWFTDYQHLNDPSELKYGIDLAHDVARDLATGSDLRIRCFLDCFVNLFQQDIFYNNLDFFIASFSRERNDLGQWRAYADNGRGIAIGFSPSVFAVSDKVQDDRIPEFVGPVRYSLSDIGFRHLLYLKKASEIFLESVIENCELMSERSIRDLFIQNFIKEIIGSTLIWNCLTSKHPAYHNEREVRLVIMGMPSTLKTHTKTRFRGYKRVPYIAQPFPIHEPNKIAEIVVGPAAPIDAEKNIRDLIVTLGIKSCIPIRRSGIPYRAA